MDAKKREWKKDGVSMRFAGRYYVGLASLISDLRFGGQFHHLMLMANHGHVFVICTSPDSELRGV